MLDDDIKTIESNHSIGRYGNDIAAWNRIKTALAEAGQTADNSKNAPLQEADEPFDITRDDSWVDDPNMGCQG